ncbi:ANKRD17 [Mytilus edulis]|uniref:ANKRD17 n=1 Tax=Mytilus edulis TaxID=6550 RepID=A0A8S3R330_MYTED|nr:ANKRD17 [Mytilus edulis]
MESEHSVLIIGEPGIGKSMLMHNVALNVQKNNDYNIIPCFDIQDILQHYKQDAIQMFVLDDICGRLQLECLKNRTLMDNEDKLKRILKKGKTKIVATCRLDVYNDEKFKEAYSVFKSNIFNLSERYTREDKIKICRNYLSEADTQLCDSDYTLTAACHGGNEMIVQLLLDKGNDVNQVDGMKRTPLSLLVEGNEKIVMLLVDKSWRDVNQVRRDVNQADGYEKTPLIKGSDVNQVNDKGNTALTMACKYRNEKIVQVLIDNRSLVNQVDGLGMTPLTVACSGRNENKEYTLTAACNRGDEELVQLLLDKGRMLTVDTGGGTPLTISHGQRKWEDSTVTLRQREARLTQRKKCDVNQDDGAREHLTAACNRGDEELVQLLVRKDVMLTRLVATDAWRCRSGSSVFYLW